MQPRSALQLRSERGQSSAEYIGLILVVAAIISAIAASGIGGTITQGIENAICSIAGSSCDQRAGPGAVALPAAGTRVPGERDGVDPGPQRGAPADRGPDGRSGSAGERPRASDRAAPAPDGGDPASEAPASGVELGADGATAPEPFDPPAPDPGSGAYDSEGAGIADRVNKEKWYAAADAAEALGYTDAARHLRHYLDNSGEPLEVDVGSLLHDEVGLREAVGNQVSLATRAALESYDGSGLAEIPIRTSWRVFTASGRTGSTAWAACPTASRGWFASGLATRRGRR